MLDKFEPEETSGGSGRGIKKFLIMPHQQHSRSKKSMSTEARQPTLVWCYLNNPHRIFPLKMFFKLSGGAFFFARGQNFPLQLATVEVAGPHKNT
jgi:hypothetical protein